MTQQASGPTFGSRVVGKDAYDKAVRETKGGGNVFGKRVRDAIPENGPVGERKRATEHGPLVVAGATASDTKGKVTDGLSIDQIRNVLTENPTFFDSLYEAELARPEGARPDALEVFLQVEIGIKGAGRQEIIGEIRGLLGAKKVTAAQQADQNRLHLQQREEMAQRTEENALLADADRARSLARREEDIAMVRKSRESKTDQSAPRPLMMDSQREAMAGDDAAEDDSRLAHPRTPSKPEGDIHPETQTSGERPLVPKGTSSETGSDTNSEGGETGDGAASEREDKSDDKDATGDEEKRLKKMTVKQLTKEARKAKVDVDEVEGSGADGAVLKADLVSATLAKQKEG